MEMREHRHSAIGYSTLIVVWILLLFFTWLTVGMSGAKLGMLSLAAPFLIASVKSFLVVDYFMHLKYESVFFKWILLVVLGTVLIVTWLVYEDIIYRVG